MIVLLLSIFFLNKIFFIAFYIFFLFVGNIYSQKKKQKASHKIVPKPPTLYLIIIFTNKNKIFQSSLMRILVLHSA